MTTAASAATAQRRGNERMRNRPLDRWERCDPARMAAGAGRPADVRLRRTGTLAPTSANAPGTEYANRLRKVRGHRRGRRRTGRSAPFHAVRSRVAANPRPPSQRISPTRSSCFLIGLAWEYRGSDRGATAWTETRDGGRDRAAAGHLPGVFGARLRTRGAVA